MSWEMDEPTLKGAWRDLGRNEIDMAKVLLLAHHGYRLYETKRGRDRRYTAPWPLLTPVVPGAKFVPPF